MPDANKRPRGRPLKEGALTSRRMIRMSDELAAACDAAGLEKVRSVLAAALMGA